MSSLEQLPVSVLRHIFRNHLDSNELRALIDSSEKFKAIIETSQELQQKLFMDQPSTFERMPLEIKERILSCLPSSALCSLAATCRTFSQIINGSDKLSKTMTLYLRYPKDVKAFVSDISNTSRRFKSLNIKRVREATRLSDSNSATTMRAFYELMRIHLGPDIENLSVSWKNPSNIRDINYTVDLQRIIEPIHRRNHVIFHNIENNNLYQGNHCQY